MKYKYINYIIDEFQKHNPIVPIEKIENVLFKYSEDELYRLSNAIERFGVKNIIYNFD